MEGRFLSWCLLLIAWIAVLAGGAYLLARFGLSGWPQFGVLIPVFLLCRFTVQRFLAKGRR